MTILLSPIAMTAFFFTLAGAKAEPSSFRSRLPVA
jgi:hypothetical protein